MNGNVSEWVEDIFAESYANLPTDGSANVSIGKKEFRVIREKSFQDDRPYC